RARGGRRALTGHRARLALAPARDARRPPVELHQVRAHALEPGIERGGEPGLLVEQARETERPEAPGFGRHLAAYLGELLVAGRALGRELDRAPGQLEGGLGLVEREPDAGEQPQGFGVRRMGGGARLDQGPGAQVVAALDQLGAVVAPRGARKQGERAARKQRERDAGDPREHARTGIGLHGGWGAAHSRLRVRGAGLSTRAPASGYPAARFRVPPARWRRLRSRPASRGG